VQFGAYVEGVPLVQVALQGPQQRRIRLLAPPPGAAALQHLQTALRRAARRLVQEPRLADTGLPRKQENGRTRTAQVAVEQGQLVAAADQWGEVIRRHRGWHVWETQSRMATTKRGLLERASLSRRQPKSRR
jgi:hypothetical protein